MEKSNSKVEVRQASVADVPSIVAARAADPIDGPADPRTAAYLAGTHHPQCALRPRVIIVAWKGSTVIGYIAGHRTTRYDCEGELQYFWVAADQRRQGIGTRLLASLAQWFQQNGAGRICVDVLPDNLAARSFYTRYGATELNPHWLIWEDMTASGPIATDDLAT